MKVKTSELTGVALDRMVAECAGVKTFTLGGRIFDPTTSDELGTEFKPSTSWAQAGPIIEREKINLAYEPSLVYDDSHRWKAAVPFSFDKDVEMYEFGPTPLIAAMRCYVASKLGDEIEIPEELV